MKPRHKSGSLLTRPNRTKLLSAAIMVMVLTLPTPTQAQGCAQCRDNTAATSPATQRAYRHAILLMGAAAATFFTVTLILFKRNP